jgi:hypothetical protein
MLNLSETDRVFAVVAMTAALLVLAGILAVAALCGQDWAVLPLTAICCGWLAMAIPVSMLAWSKML